MILSVAPASILKLPVLVPPVPPLISLNAPALTWTVPVLLKMASMKESSVVVPFDLVKVPALLKVDIGLS